MRYKLLNTGKVICIPFIETIRIQRIKLNSMIKLKLKEEKIETTRNSFNVYLSLENSYICKHKLSNLK